MNNAIKIITDKDQYGGGVSYAENLMWINDENDVAITCRRTPSKFVIKTRKDMNRILVYTTHFKSKIIPCNLS